VNQPSPGPAVVQYVNLIRDAPPGPVALITTARTPTWAFTEACRLLGRRAVVIHPDHLERRLAGLELARALVDDRVHLGEQRRVLLFTRMRVPGSGEDQIRWIEPPA
jgi:hypothetical protein